ncbi:MAG TPA: hypothetical protein VGQ44_01450 [Gemmatimonadaceae bacterium]|jgi:hypothetical protein|nr:hypothetical protein [Gemmatimonadaceae bacterium]
MSFADWAAPEATFHRIRLRGVGGSLVWGWHTVATFKHWTIRKGGREIWLLTAAIERVEPYQIRMTPLLFSAPRETGPPWCWGVNSIDVGDRQLMARLGPPEQ